LTVDNLSILPTQADVFIFNCYPSREKLWVKKNAIYPGSMSPCQYLPVMEFQTALTEMAGSHWPGKNNATPPRCTSPLFVHFRMFVHFRTFLHLPIKNADEHHINYQWLIYFLMIIPDYQRSAWRVRLTRGLATGCEFRRDTVF
jgi:hypothetical protein